MKKILFIISLIVLFVAIIILARFVYAKVNQNKIIPIYIPEGATFNQAVYDGCFDDLDMLGGYSSESCSYERGKLVIIFSDESTLESRKDFLDTIGAQLTYQGVEEVKTSLDAMLTLGGASIDNVPRGKEKEYACRILAMETDIVSKIYGSVSCTNLGL